jgi:hypothetical protein
VRFIVPSDAGECMRVTELSRCGVTGGERSKDAGSSWCGGVTARSTGVSLVVTAGLSSGVVVGVADSERNL